MVISTFPRDHSQLCTESSRYFVQWTLGEEDFDVLISTGEDLHLVQMVFPTAFADVLAVLLLNFSLLLVNRSWKEACPSAL